MASNKYVICLAAVAFGVLAPYLAFAFLMWEVNPGNWVVVMRGAYVFVALIACFYTLKGVFIEHHYENY